MNVVNKSSVLTCSFLTPMLAGSSSAVVVQQVQGCPEDEAERAAWCRDLGTHSYTHSKHTQYTHTVHTHTVHTHTQYTHTHTLRMRLRGLGKLSSSQSVSHNKSDFLHSTVM